MLFTLCHVSIKKKMRPGDTSNVTMSSLEGMDLQLKKLKEDKLL